MQAESLKQFHGIHAGQPAVVIGAGPSLRHLQPEWLDGFVTFAVNEGFVACPDCDYYLSNDVTVTMRRHWQSLPDARCLLLLHLPGGFTHPAIWQQFPVPDSRRKGFLRWDDNAALEALGIPLKQGDDAWRMDPDDEATVVGVCSSHQAVHIAYLMGCSPIVLLGMDCCFEGDKFYWYQFGNTPDDPRTANEVCRTYGSFAESDLLKQRCATMVDYWQMYADASPHVTILNASGGRLEAFPRIQMCDLPKYSRTGKDQHDAT